MMPGTLDHLSNILLQNSDARQFEPLGHVVIHTHIQYIKCT